MMAHSAKKEMPIFGGVLVGFATVTLIGLILITTMGTVIPLHGIPASSGVIWLMIAGLLTLSNAANLFSNSVFLSGCGPIGDWPSTAHSRLLPV